MCCVIADLYARGGTRRAGNRHPRGLAGGRDEAGGAGGGGGGEAGGRVMLQGVR